MNTKSVSKIILVMMILNIVATCPISVYAETVESVNSLNGKKLIAMFDDGVKFQVEPHTLSQSGWVEVKIIDPGFKEAGLGSISAKSDHQGFKDFTENWKSQVPEGKPVTDTRVWVEVPWEPMGSGKYDIEIEYNGKIYLIDPWWDIDWDRNRKIVFNNFDSSEDLTEIPVKINLNSSHIDWTKINSDYSDIRFIDADNTTVLSYEMVNWNYTGQVAEMWVKVPQIDAGSITDHIYLYYNNTGASSVENATGVWSNGYEAVYHFSEGSGVTVYDSTINSNTGTIESNRDSTCVVLDGNGDRVEFGSVSDYNITDYLTVDFWLKTDQNDGTNDRIIWSNNLWSSGWTVYQNGLVVGLSVHIDGTMRTRTNGDITLGSWNHIVGTYSKDTHVIEVTINGTDQSDITLSGLSTYELTHSPGAIHVSRLGVEDFNGRIDELRIYNRVISDEEILYSYNNYVPQDQTDLVLWADFNSDYVDQSTVGNDGSSVGDPYFTAGVRDLDLWQVDGQLTFDGVNDYVLVPADSSMNFTDAMTIDTSIVFDYSAGGYESIVGKHYTGMHYYRNDNNPSAIVYRNNGVYYSSSSNTWVDGSLYNLGVTLENGGSVNHYLNGSSVGTVSMSNDIYIIPSYDFYIGQRSDDAGFLNGSISEMMFSGEVRTAEWEEAFSDILFGTYYSWDVVDTNIYWSSLQNQYINQGFNVECSVTATSPSFMIDTVVFSHNRTGVWVNQTQSFDANPDILIKNLQIPETKGYKTAYRWYFKNEYGTWNSTSPVTVETIHDVNIIDLMLWGDGAFIGHFVTLILLLVLKRFFGMAGNLMAMVGSVGMMLLTFSTMPSTNPAFIMVIGYVVMTVIAVPWRT